MFIQSYLALSSSSHGLRQPEPCRRFSEDSSTARCKFSARLELPVQSAFERENIKTVQSNCSLHKRQAQLPRPGGPG